MIKILIVEDTPVIKEYLKFILDSDPDMEVIGTAGNGEEALQFLEKQVPDVITMDIHMPKMDGFEATRRIMETNPVPIIIVSGSTDPSEVAVTFKAMEAGAVSITLRPPGIGHPDHNKESKKLIEIVRLMSEIKVVKRRFKDKDINKSFSQYAMTTGKMDMTRIKQDIKIVAVGASTGGPPVINSLLQSLPGDYSIPILIVQHIARGFIEGFVDWLRTSSPLPVHIGVHGEKVMPGNVYLAPDNFHMGISPDGIIQVKDGIPEHGLCPSVSYLFRSVATSYGEKGAGILLTGMGKDGAEELLYIKDKGGLTVAQDAETSVVHGMPGEAISLNAAKYILSPEMIAGMLKQLV